MEKENSLALIMSMKVNLRPVIERKESLETITFSMKGSSKIIPFVDWAGLCLRMEQIMKANFKMANFKAKEYLPFQMVRFIKDNLSKENILVREILFGLKERKNLQNILNLKS